MDINVDLAPDDSVEVNTRTLEVLLNGGGTGVYLSGEVFDLSGGSNTIVYDDGETSRTVEIKIIYNPRYL